MHWIPNSYKVGICKVCSSNLSNYTVGMRARRVRSDGKPAPDLSYFHSWCLKCNIKYTNSSDDLPSNWECSNVKEEELLDEINQEEVNQILLKITEKLSPDIKDLILPLWDEFLSLKQDGDLFFKYKKKNHDHCREGLVLKRGAHIIADQLIEYSEN